MGRKMNGRNRIYSVFGEIEYITIHQMMAEGKDIRLLYPTEKIHDLEMLPPRTRFNELGQQVRCVVIIHKDTIPEWNRRIAESRY